MSKFVRIANVVMMALYLFSVVVQYNDPDPMRWMVVYGAAALACLLFLLGRMPRWLPALVGIGSVVWLALWMPRVLGQVPLSEMFRERGMATVKIEEGREAIGLALVLGWMAVLTFVKQGKRE